MKKLQRFYPHALAVLGFVLVSLIYFYPVLQGKKILQSDIVQYTAMAKEQNDFRSETHTEPYWTNSAFGGMPTYQLGANYPHNYIKTLDSVIRFLPRPADYMFLYFLGFYVLLLVMKVNPLKAFFGAIAFGFSTYLIIILGVGHNAKALAIAYMPLVIAGVLLVYRSKYIVGGLLTLIAVALEINANHFQMTYYLLIFLLIVTVYFSYKAIKSKEVKPLLYSFGTFAVAGILAIGANATNILATSEYSKESTRGKTELTFNPDGSKNEEATSMTYDYITEYSYGLAESFDLISPRIFGGSNNENVGTNSAMYEYVVAQNVPEDQAKEIVKGLPTYWGDQPIVAAPAYIGAVVFFLAILALFCDKRKIKYVFLSGILVSLFLSWGKNFSLLTDFFINCVPMYNKFRAVSSIQVVLEICFPVLAIMGLQSFFKLENDQKWPNLWKSAAACVGTLTLLFLFKGSFSFAGGSDSYLIQSYGPEFVNALKEDRKAMFSSDLMRSALFILLAFAAMWLSIKNTISHKAAVILVGLLMISDLFFIDKNYLNDSSFVSAHEVEQPIQETSYDTTILKDKSYYRVFEVSQNAMSEPRASYFHKSIGGYSAVKPRRMQELFDYQIAKNNMEVLDMLNVKYLIQTNEKGEQITIKNTAANGNAWFVKEVKTVNSANDEMKALDKFDSKNVAILNTKDFGNATKKTAFTKDTTAVINLNSYEPNELKYTSINSNDGLAVFSEMYYKNGWNAYIDGKLQDHFKVDYALRGLLVPAGKHNIEFKFEPQVVKTGSMISLISFILILILLGYGIYLERKKSKES
ncbi:YfhO family protein [Flavobacterium sp.]|uniref:YfhO family protein n=1 Tax=Flavobacterium sp. TaxID=239 RepID=UPI002633D7A5|nr:YfhO family protein [Flavobacterium sp.]